MANVYNIFIDQGSTYSVTLEVTDSSGAQFDLTGYTAESQIRKTYTSTDATANFTASLNINEGTVTLSISDSITNNISAGRYVYDCIITDQSGVKTRILEGQATITPGVTR